MKSMSSYLSIVGLLLVCALGAVVYVWFQVQRVSKDVHEAAIEQEKESATPVLPTPAVPAE